MKETAFIISEYNPFHNGHKFHIDETRRAGAKNIICIMNGNFMQRGEPSILSKEARAKTAVMNGADLVIELPMKYGISSANFFAEGGIKTITATGLDGTLSFGAKNSALQLNEVSEILCKEKSLDTINNISKAKGKSFACACEMFLCENFPQYAEMLSDANNILGIEYIKSAKIIGAKFDFHAVKRSLISCHDSLITENGIASAKYIRSLINDGKIEKTADFLPQTSYSVFLSQYTNNNCVINQNKFSDMVFSRLLSLQANYFTEINGVSQGLENKILDEIKNTSSLDSLCQAVKSKRFTYARIKQILVAACFNITREDLSSGVNYIRVLAFNDIGRRLLREMTDKSKVPVITKLSDITEKMSLQALKDRDTDYLAGKIYELCKENPKNENPEYLVKPFYSK